MIEVVFDWLLFLKGIAVLIVLEAFFETFLGLVGAPKSRSIHHYTLVDTANGIVILAWFVICLVV